MAISINSSSSSFAVNQLRESSKTLASSLEKIASGKRINKAADDAAGLAIANSLLSQGQGLGQAIRNANDAISMTQIADSALNESTALVQSIRQKALQAANAGQSAESRQALQSEIDKSLSQLDNIAQNTTYNGQQLLSGTFTNKSFQVGATGGETITLSIGSARPGQLGGPEGGMLTDIDVTSAEGAQAAIGIADQALTQLDASRGRIGSAQNQLSSTINNLSTTQVNVLSAASTISDVDLAEEIMNFTKMQVLNEAKSFALAQTRNMNKQNVLSLLQG
ncbi:flagellin N-terminal helical domain-containing protein [Thiovibrio sp. JS02]